MYLKEKKIGTDCPVYIIGEIGINHNGDIKLQKIKDSAVNAGCDAVKFQKRNPDICVPDHQKSIMRETPWGYISYLDYKYKVEFGKKEYDIIDDYCKKKNIHWFVSCWDNDSVDFILDYDTPCIKVASASITDYELLNYIKSTNLPVIISSGMSTIDEVKNSVKIFSSHDLALLHSVSTYPAKIEELNLNVIRTYYDLFPNTSIGYSGHEVGLSTSYAAVALGAKIIERHITLDRSMWGTDQGASIEPQGLIKLVKNIRVIENSLGDGKKVVTNSEKSIRKKLRLSN